MEHLLKKIYRGNKTPLQGQIHEFSIEGAQTLFKKKSGGAWVSAHSQVPCLCKNKGVRPCFCKNKRGRAPGVPPLNLPLPPPPRYVTKTVWLDKG